MKKRIGIIVFFIIGITLAFFVFNFSTNRNEAFLSTEKETKIKESDSQLKTKENSDVQVGYQYLTAKIKIGEKNFSIEIPTTEAAMIQGLSQRKNLDVNNGMLFVFTEKERHSFRMKEMNFNLDFVFINDDNIVDIKEDIDQNSKEAIVGREIYNQVLEINAGSVKEDGLKIGDKVQISYH